MVNDKLLEIIKELKKQGKTENEIKELLQKYDVSLSEIEEHLKHYSDNIFSNQPSVSENQNTDNAPRKPFYEENIKTPSNNSVSQNSSYNSVEKSKGFNFKPLLVILVIIFLGAAAVFFFTDVFDNNSLDNNSLDSNVSNTDDISSNIDSENEELSSFQYPLGEPTSFNLAFSEDEQEIDFSGEVNLNEDDTYDLELNYDILLNSPSDEELYSVFGGVSMLSYFYPNLILAALDSDYSKYKSELDLFSSFDYFSLPDDLRARYILLSILYPKNLMEEEITSDLSKFSSVILNSNYNYNNFVISYNIKNNDEIINIFEINLNNNLKEVEIKNYNLETSEFEIQTIPFEDLFEDMEEDYSQNNVPEDDAPENNLNNNVYGNFNLSIDFSKDIYFVGENLEGSKYNLSYQGEPFKARIIYAKSKDQGHISYSSSKGNISNGSFDDSLSILRHSLYSLTPDLEPQPFTSDGEYSYSISVYSCDDIDNAMNTDDCGDGGYPPSIDLEDIVSEVVPLATKSKTISVYPVDNDSENLSQGECVNNLDCTQSCPNCKDGSYICMHSNVPENDLTCVECINNYSCLDGYVCENYLCVEDENEELEDPNNSRTILDCYNDDFSEITCSAEEALEFSTTFENRLASCEISNGTFALGFEPFLFIFRGYEILGETNGNCNVRFWFLENNSIDSSLLNKDMTCEYDSSKRTSQAVNDCLEDCCSGELVDVISNLFEQ
ncbi:MAG: hypothetical protein PHX47_04295 [Candidatus ainarchaeum sp.]|nr:hypothetical protein [Candidatus ainarchaeum sp.]